MVHMLIAGLFFAVVDNIFHLGTTDRKADDRTVL